MLDRLITVQLTTWVHVMFVVQKMLQLLNQEITVIYQGNGKHLLPTEKIVKFKPKP